MSAARHGRERRAPVSLEEASTPEAKLTLTISLDKSTGDIEVNGPIMDLGLCYALLEQAKDVVRAYQIKLRMPKPNGGILNFARRNGH